MATVFDTSSSYDDFVRCNQPKYKPRPCKTGRVMPETKYDENVLWQKAQVDVPKYRAKLVEIVNGQYELSVTEPNPQGVINARMGFNPLLDTVRRELPDDLRAIRDEENKKRASKRARQNVRHLVKAMSADHMLTFSYRENIIDRETVAKNWHEFVRLFRVRYPDWAYVSVVEKQDRGAYHLHVAVKGKQQIKWLRRCWLIAIGQSKDDVFDWLYSGKKLGDKSLGAVNVQAPTARWGGASKVWRRDKLSGYLSKYIGKDLDASEKSAKKYWASRNIQKPVVFRFWLDAKSYQDAVREAHDIIMQKRIDNISMWGNSKDGVLWIQADVEPENLSWYHCPQVENDLHLYQ